MSIKRTFIAAIVGLTLVATLVPGQAQGVTIDELLAQIAQLQAQLVALQGGTTTTTSTSSYSACAGVTFTRTLTVGSTGSDVKCLQQILNGTGYTIASSGAGSPGSETTYFGSLTLAAVKVWQAAQGWTAANQIGPKSIALLNSIIAGSTTTTSTGTTTTTTATGAVTATLSVDTPASGGIINSQATADLLHINFTGSGTVTSVTLQRSGISTQNTLSNVYLYDGNTRLTDGYSFNSNGTLTMNGLSIAVSGSKVVSVKADTASDAATYASSIAVTLTSYVADGTTTSASVTGNTMSVVTGSTATVSVGSNTASGTTINAGTSQYAFWTAPVQVNTRSVLLKGANFKMIGSAPSDALSNIKLFIDGVDTGKVGVVGAIQGSNYVMFDLASSPVTLTTGSHTVEVRADVQKGTNRTIQLTLQQAADLTITDTQVGVNVAVTTTGSSSFSANNGPSLTINWGTVTTTVDSTFTSYTNITSGATNAVIGKYTVHAYGEDVKVSSLVVRPLVKSATTTGSTCTTDANGTTVTGTCGLNNVAIYFNGSQVGSSVNWTHAQMATATAITFQLGSQMIIPAGTDSTIEIRADLQTAGSVNYTGGTIVSTLVGDTDNAYGQSSQYTVGVPQTSSISTTGLEISSASVVVSKNSALASYTATPNTTGVKIGSFIVQNQSTSESVRLTTLTVALTSNGSTALTSTELSGLSALRTSDTTGSGSTPVQPAASNTFSVSDTLAAGGSMTIDIYANVGSSTLISAVVPKLTVASIGVTSNISDSGTATTGQTVSFGTGTITNPPTLVASSSTAAQYIAAAGGAQNAAQATFKFISTSGASTITELKFAVSGSDATPTQTVTQVCAGSVCAAPVNGTVSLVGLNLSVPNGGSGLTQAIQISYAGVGTGGIIPGKTSTIGLSYVKYTSGGTTKTLCTTAVGTCTAALSANVSANDITLVGSKPTVVVSTGGNTGMILNAETKVGEVVVTADAKGAINVGTIVFSVGFSGYSTTPTSISSARLADSSGNSIAGFTCTPGSISSGTATVSCVSDTDTYAGHYTVDAGQSQTFTLYATTAGGANTGTNKAQITSSLTRASFKWDDTSYNGSDSNGVNLTGTLIYGFPTNSYYVSQ